MQKGAERLFLAMNFLEHIIQQIAEKECTKICRRVIRNIQAMTDGLQSGDDSGLTNIWDEFCVQVQSEHSMFYDLYEETILMTLRYMIEPLPAYIAQSIWLQTVEGSDWAWDNKDTKQAPYCVEDIRDYIFREYIFAEADRWSNQRIRVYLGE